jgi:hypothetical protein
MPNSLLVGLVIRTAAARRPGLGFIYAADPKREANEEPHAVTFRYNDGVFTKGEANFDAHSLTVVTQPEPGLVAVSGAGYYSANTAKGTTTGDIFEDSTPRPPQPRTTGIRSAATVEGRAYAIGLRGMVYRFEGSKRWTRIDDGLPNSFDGQAIHGFSGNEIYAVGRKGQMWRFDGQTWIRLELPTSVTLTCVMCAGDGNVYVGGHHGVLLRGRGDAWGLIEQPQVTETIWDVEWFRERLYVSTMTNVYYLSDANLVAVDFGPDRPRSCYQLSAGEGVLWSNGEFDIMSFDGAAWTRVV